MLFTNFSKSLVGIFNHSDSAIFFWMVPVDSENPIDAQLASFHSTTCTGALLSMQYHHQDFVQSLTNALLTAFYMCLL